MSKYTQQQIVKADGSFAAPAEFTMAYLQQQIEGIAQFPSDLEAVLKPLSKELLNTPYRDGGWTLNQVVHHIADSHMQAFARFKLTLTEDNPVIKPYHQDLWVTTADCNIDTSVSLDLIKALHIRFVAIMKSLSESDFKKEYIHPEYKRNFSLAFVTGMYAWHGYHHLQQISMFLENQI